MGSVKVSAYARVHWFSRGATFSYVGKNKMDLNSGLTDFDLWVGQSNYSFSMFACIAVQQDMFAYSAIQQDRENST